MPSLVRCKDSEEARGSCFQITGVQGRLCFSEERNVEIQVWEYLAETEVLVAFGPGKIFCMAGL